MDHDINICIFCCIINANTDGLGEKVNEQGVAFYNDLINFMISKGTICFTD